MELKICIRKKMKKDGNKKRMERIGIDDGHHKEEKLIDVVRDNDNVDENSDEEVEEDEEKAEKKRINKRRGCRSRYVKNVGQVAVAVMSRVSHVWRKGSLERKVMSRGAASD